MKRPGWGGGGAPLCRPSEFRPPPPLTRLVLKIRAFPEFWAADFENFGCVVRAGLIANNVTMEIAEVDNADFGPAMRALTPKMRAFAQVMVANPGCNRSKAAIAAGYSGESPGAVRVTVHRLMHDERVLAALDELTVNRLQSTTLVAASALERIITSRNTLDKDRLKAIGMVLDRTGHSATQTINVNKTVTRKVDVSAAAQKIAEFRRRFPEQFARLIGGEVVPVLEGEFSEAVAE